MPRSNENRRDGERRNVLDSVQPAFPGANADRLLDSGDEDLSVADATGLRRIADGLDSTVDELVRKNDLYLHFGKKIDNVFGPAVELGVALLASEALRLGHRDALQSYLLQRLLH